MKPTLLIASTLALAAAEVQAAERVAIQAPRYAMFHELKLSLGALPIDPFQKGWSVGGSYTLHLDRYWAWEVVQVTGALLTSTDMREELIDTFAVPPEDFAAPRLLATTGLELTPLYGKQALLNDAIVHHSLLVGAYAGVVFGDRGSLGGTLSDLRPAAGIGLGYRLYATEVVSLRFDVRNLLSLRRAIRSGERFELDNVLLLTLSVALNLGRDDA